MSNVPDNYGSPCCGCGEMQCECGQCVECGALLDDDGACPVCDAEEQESNNEQGADDE